MISSRVAGEFCLKSSTSFKVASILSPTSVNHCKAESLDDSKSSDTAIGLGRGVGKRGREEG